MRVFPMRNCVRNAQLYMLCQQVKGVGRKGVGTALSCFEREMGARCDRTVQGSRDAAQFYHSKDVLREFHVAGSEDSAVLIAELAKRKISAAAAGELEGRVLRCRDSLLSSATGSAVAIASASGT